MPTAGERITALEAEVAALRDAVAALRLEAVPGALAALAADQLLYMTWIRHTRSRNVYLTQLLKTQVYMYMYMYMYMHVRAQDRDGAGAARYTGWI